MIVVQDILAAVQRSTGQNNQSVLYEYINRAIECLANIQPADATMPLWDPLLIYVNLPTQNPPSNLVILPYEIERPVNVNVNSLPTFSRSRLFEFTLNGPGSSLTESGWQFQDRGLVPIQKFIVTPSTMTIASSAGASDAAVVISAIITVPDTTGLSSSGFTEQSVTWTLGAGGTLTTSQTIADIREVYKPVTQGTITFTMTTGTVLIASYPPSMTKPEYAVVKISQPGYSVRMLARRKKWKVALPTDWIPLSNQMSLIVATQYIKFLEEVDYTNAPFALAMATQLLQNDQASKMAFAAVAAGSQMATPLNLNIIARDVLQANDVYDEFCSIFGPIGQQKIFDQMTEAIEGLGNQSDWDPLIGYCDLLVQNFVAPYVTLPRDVDAILALNLNGRPGPFRSKWFEFNLDGLGEAEFYKQGSLGPATLTPLQNYANRDWKGYDDAGEVVTAFDIIPGTSGYLLAWPFSNADIGATVQVYGLDNNLNPLGGAPDVGITIPCNQNYASALSNPQVTRIDRVTKQSTQGFVGLLLTDGLQNIQTLATYWPDDIEPVYRRIKIQLGPGQQQPQRIRIRYRKRWLKITSLTDIIPLKNRSALTMFARYLFQIKGGQAVQMFSENMRQAAIDLANADWRAHNPSEQMTIQWDRATYGGHFHSVY